MSDIRFFQVGGCVRDGILGVKTKDIDFAVEAPDFETMSKAVHARCSKVFLETPEFLTIRGLDPELGAVDFVLCRKDGPSSDGRRPDFVEPGTILDDLARRDFTVNSLALTDEGELLDPHGGVIDLNNRVLRFVGVPRDRLTEDALRAFRAVRFAVTKGFAMTTETIMAISAMQAGDFDAVSTDRIRDELFKMFAKDTRGALNIMLQFPAMLQLAFDRGLWLEPTMRTP
jgi:tRNA nucleotidyltransferase/poly(A) polymerase